MNLGKYIFGIREEYLMHSSPSHRKRQLFIYNVLSVMLLFLTVLILISGIIYGLVIFQNWIIAILTGFFLAGVTFNLLLLVLFLNLNSGFSDLNEQVTEMEPVFNEYRPIDLSNSSDEDLKKIVEKFISEMRNKHISPDQGRFHFSNILKSTIKVGLIMIIAVIVSSALQLFIFKEQINNSIKQVRNSPIIHERLNEKDTIQISNDQMHHAEWILEMVQPDKNSHSFLECKSIMLTFDLLHSSIGGFKIVIDVLIIVLFLLPFILIQKGNEFRGGDYLKEVCLSNIRISFYSFLISERETQRIKSAFKIGHESK